jgi:hypothetical protein
MVKSKKKTNHLNFLLAEINYREGKMISINESYNAVSVTYVIGTDHINVKGPSIFHIARAMKHKREGESIMKNIIITKLK